MKSRLPKSITIDGRRWRIDWTKPEPSDQAFALTYFEDHVIQINPDLDGELMIAAVVDELAHAAFGKCLDNEAVDVFSDAAARLLHRLGFRREDDDE